MSQRSLFPKDGLPRGLRADFDAFWNAYPPRRPNPRALAEVAFAAAVRNGAAPEDLVRAADAYHAEVRKMGIGQEFVVHAATFLRQRRFEDYLRAPVAEAPASSRPVEVDHELWPYLCHSMPLSEFRLWIEPLQVVAHSEGAAALLQAPSRFHRDWVRQHFAVPLKAALRVRILDVETQEDIRP